MLELKQVIQKKQVIQIVLSGIWIELNKNRSNSIQKKDGIVTFSKEINTISKFLDHVKNKDHDDDFDNWVDCHPWDLVE